MLDRATEEVEQFKYLELPVEGSEEAQGMLAIYEELKQVLTTCKDQTYASWKAKMDKEGSEYLEEFIIKREDASSIFVNFSVEVRRFGIRFITCLYISLD